MNSGDWVESLTALVEDEDGNWKILFYNDLLKDEKYYREDEISIMEDEEVYI